MARSMMKFGSFLVALLAILAFGPVAEALPLPLLSGPILATLRITSVSPASPTAGTPLTIYYTLTSITNVAAVTGFIDGSLGAQSLILPAKTDAAQTLAAGQTINGVLLVTPTAYGPQNIKVAFRTPLECKGVSVAHPDCLGAAIMASDQITLAIAPPTVQVRISGINHVTFAKSDSHPTTRQGGGQMCVVHSPGCSSNAFLGMFSVGQNGKDKFFPPNLSLPAGAMLLGVNFTPHLPAGMSVSNLGSSGSHKSYGLSPNVDLSASPPVYVEWQNTCQSHSLGNQPVTYEVNFVVSMPQGTDLGEPTFDPTTTTPSSCQPGDLPTYDQSNTPAIAQGVYIEQLRPLTNSSGGFTGYQAEWPSSVIPGFALQGVKNVSGYELLFVKPGSSTDNCGDAGSVIAVADSGVLTSAQMTELFGSLSVTPLPLLACVVRTPSQAQAAAISIQMTYLYLN